MNRSILAVFALASLSAMANTPPEITNVRASQREGTKLVDIYYDAADADGDALKIRVEISDNDGAKYSVPALTFTGDIGEGIAPGKNKHIVWDAGTDWDGEYSDQMRVKIFAIDAQGFPGMEWSNEIPPGGFLMGQDGGAEGSGPSRHVNIPWSYWMGKYEVTCSQYCDFLNAALVSGFVSRDDTQYVKTIPGMVTGVNVVADLLKIGDGQQIRWNVNNFEVVGSNSNMPVAVSWHGAMAFCRYYGYDLPTDAEWEKAARGPDNDDQDEHLVYPWGNFINTSCASYYSGSGLKPVGYFDGNQTPVGGDMISAYGMYDVIGNLAEWTRSYGGSSYILEDYDATENLDSLRNRARGSTTMYYVTRGGSYGDSATSSNYYLKLYRRNSQYPNQLSYCGFRVTRRSVNDISNASLAGRFSFDDQTLGTPTSLNKMVGGVTMSCSDNMPEIVTDTVKGVTRNVLLVSGRNVKITLTCRQKIRAVRYICKVGYAGSSQNSISCVSRFADGTTSEQSDSMSAYGNEVYGSGSMTFRDSATQCELKLHSEYYKIWVSDIEVLTTVD